MNAKEIERMNAKEIERMNAKEIKRKGKEGETSFTVQGFLLS